MIFHLFHQIIHKESWDGKSLQISRNKILFPQTQVKMSLNTGH